MPPGNAAIESNNRMLTGLRKQLYGKKHYCIESENNL